jgi:hypothetical protein
LLADHLQGGDEMLINRNRNRNRNRPGRGTARACPHCRQPLAGGLLHIEGLMFLCDRCLHEIHAEPGHSSRRLSLLRGRRHRGELAAG